MSDSTTNASMVPVRTGLMARISQGVEDLRSFYRQPAIQRAFPVVAAVFLVAIGLFFYVTLQVPDRTTLFASLPESEKPAVMEALRANGTDVQIDPITGEMTVPVGDYHNSRLSLASQGLPTSMPDGYSVLSDMPMGTSRSVERMRLKQSQELELSLSIDNIDVVAGSRVHLAIPERSAFARNAQNPTASVFVQLKLGRALSSQQVQAIVNLVSSSVANLPKSAVTVIDQNGRLLSDSVDDPATTLADRQLDYQLKLEDIYRRRIESLLTPVVGPGNVSAQVSLDIDFTRREVTQDMVVPDQSALLSEQSALEEEISAPSRGVPGAFTNTPPQMPSFERRVESNGEEGDAQAEESSSAKMRSSNNLRNYEVSRKVSSESSPMALLTGVHVAVLLRELSPIGESVEGGEAPLMQIGIDPEKIEEIKALVASTVGINARRGDTLTVSSMPYISSESILASMSNREPAQWHEDEWVREMARNMLILAVLAIVTLGIVKPLLTQLFATPSEGAAGKILMSDDDDIIDMDAIEMEAGQSLEYIKAKLKSKRGIISAEMLDTANSYDDKIALIRMMVDDDAGRVSNVFKGMMENDMDQ
ncbi:MAG: flagellar basal-body MS-ring/collar protein FliF [Planktotalea sp.]|jgi:flagellar M-ring protein FliF|uniref:flagellar basal-body MS-ring/collar protein FliF n=1 Tax=Planktotalea sp. TaxID=2029877 RepID=UPI00261E7A9B|nr:flagellar basal-body MS-ring/collar protein FliF [Planktotalea sp.]MDG1075051.1 flagellar basal-body MS-ring/collar protein FliF [Planktotalea sp.]